MNNQMQDLIPDPDGPFPPLPDTLPPFPEQPDEQPVPSVPIRSVRCGCYLVNYTPRGNSLVTHDGTLRVECHSNGRTASGDLYQRPVTWLPIMPGFPPANRKPVLLPGPDPATGIPVFPRDRYRYYMRVTQILELFTHDNEFTLGFEMWRFIKNAGVWSTGGTWTNEGVFTALMTWQGAPAGYPSSSDYLAGDVKNGRGIVIGRITVGWVSGYLRKATVEIDRVGQAEAPLNNGAGVDWKTIGDDIGWDITAIESDSDVAEPSGESWSDAECHAAMLSRRDSSNLDREWCYHILCVRYLDSASRGIMYDAYGGDSNNVPREGCSLSSHWTAPDTAEWGLIRGMRIGSAAAPYFRSAVHETGHAMGLYHNTVDNCFMNTTNLIAGNSLTPGSPAFPNNIQWMYNSEDALRLRHMPDIYVRPGGTPFGTNYAATPINPADLEVEIKDLELQVALVRKSVPLGAPVRINIELINLTDTPVAAPASLSMKSGLVKGKVMDPSGVMRTFSPLLICIEDLPLAVLNPKQSVHNSLTLLRGAQGSLFPMPGIYRIIVEVHWGCTGAEAIITGETDLMVTSAVDEAHAQAALKILSTPDALLTLVIGGDHLTHGIEAIRTALENPVLRPHFTYIEAKRLAERFGNRKADLKTAAHLIDNLTVMSPAEIKKAAGLVQAGGADNVSGKQIAGILKNMVNTMDIPDEIRNHVDSL